MTKVWPKIILDTKWSWDTIFLAQYFLTQISLGPNLFWPIIFLNLDVFWTHLVKKLFWTQNSFAIKISWDPNFFGPNILRTQNLLDPKKSFHPKFFDSKFFWTKHFFGPNNLFYQKFFWTRKFWPKLFWGEKRYPIPV